MSDDEYVITEIHKRKEEEKKRRREEIKIDIDDSEEKKKEKENENENEKKNEKNTIKSKKINKMIEFEREHDLMESDYKQEIKINELMNCVDDINSKINMNTSTCRYKIYYVCGLSFFIVSMLSNLSTIYHNF